MSLWSKTLSLFTGVDLDAEQARSDKLDQATRDLNQEYLERGLWTQDQYDEAMANLDTGNQSTGAADVVGAVTEEAQAGLQEGLDNVLNAPGKVVGAAGQGAGQLLWGIVKSIPWWAWFGAGVALFIWMGGLALLRGRLAKHA
jgi:hypothetical protein